MKFKLLLLIALCAATVSRAQAFDSYASGYYFDTNHNKHTGLLKLNAVYSSLEFKTDEMQTPVKLTTQEVTAFVMEKDSFTVVGDYEVPYGFSSTTISSSFAKVIKTGEVTLYEVATVAGYQQNEAIISGSYLLQKNNSSQVMRVPDGAVRFKKVLSDYFSESGIVSQQIKSGTFTHDHLLEIVDLYNREHTMSAIASQTMNGF
jgi:hypothetical protein